LNIDAKKAGVEEGAEEEASAGTGSEDEGKMKSLIDEELD